MQAQSSPRAFCHAREKVSHLWHGMSNWVNDTTRKKEREQGTSRDRERFRTIWTPRTRCPEALNLKNNGQHLVQSSVSHHRIESHCMDMIMCSSSLISSSSIVFKADQPPVAHLGNFHFICVFQTEMHITSIMTRCSTPVMLIRMVLLLILMNKTLDFCPKVLS